MNSTALSAVADYLTNARWYGGKGREVTVVGARRVGTLAADPDATGGPVVGIELVTLEYPGAEPLERETYQVPLSYYEKEQERLDHALVGAWEDDELGAVVAYDAVHDREAAALYLRAFDDAAAGDVVRGELVFRRLPGHDLDLETHSTLFSGEQSNSSLAFGADALMKVFRKVNTGRNPDIVIHEALTVRESEHVAALFGWLELTAPGDTDEPVQLAMLQQFLRTASDGWDLALASVRDLFAEADLHADEVGGDFAGEAERLGLATAQVHDVLAEEFPTESWGADDLAALSDAMLTRLEVALAIVPELGEHADGAAGHLPRRRVHRQLRPERHRPARARRLPPRPDAAHRQGLEDRGLRGRAGQAPCRAGPPGPGLARRGRDAALVRLRRTRRRGGRAGRGRRRLADRVPGAGVGRPQHRAFLRGYVDNSGRTSEGALSPEQDLILRAYIADKAIYEAVYEARNRPSWLPIPLGAIARITQPAAHPDVTEANDA